MQRRLASARETIEIQAEAINDANEKLKNMNDAYIREHDKCLGLQDDLDAEKARADKYAAALREISDLARNMGDANPEDLEGIYHKMIWDMVTIAERSDRRRPVCSEAEAESEDSDDQE
jgi:hypothetical protein